MHPQFEKLWVLKIKSYPFGIQKRQAFNTLPDVTGIFGNN